MTLRAAASTGQESTECDIVPGDVLSDSSSPSSSQSICSPSSYSTAPDREIGRNIRITVCSNQGGRKYMEDRVHVEVVRGPDGNIDYTFVAVYDGHGGSEASEFCRKNMLKNIQAMPGFNSEEDDDFLDAIRTGFLTTHDQMWKIFDTWNRTQSGYPSTAGTTASVAFIRRGKLYTGHVGDSAIVLGYRDTPHKHRRLTEDHKPDSLKERTRIERSGGNVQQKAFVHRVVWTRPLRGHSGPIRRHTPTESIPFLAVARSLGDFWSFCEETGQFVVSPHPDVSCITLTEDHAGIVLASDGLTNVMSNQSVTSILHSLETSNIAGFKKNGKTVVHPNHARVLMRRTFQQWKRFRADNISIIAVLFDPPGCTVCPEAIDAVLPPQHSLDYVFTQSPDCMVAVSDERTLRVRTAHAPLVYYGIFDFNFVSMKSVGPGFLSHEDESRRDAERDEEALNSDYGVASLSGALEEFYDAIDLVPIERDGSPENAPPPSAKKPIAVVAPSPKLALGGESRKTDENADNGENYDNEGPLPKRFDYSRVDEAGKEDLVLARDSSGRKLKYYCREHGVLCAKARRYNEKFYEQCSSRAGPSSSLTTNISPDTIPKVSVRRDNKLIMDMAAFTQRIRADNQKSQVSTVAFFDHGNSPDPDDYTGYEPSDLLTPSPFPTKEETLKKPLMNSEENDIEEGSPPASNTRSSAKKANSSVIIEGRKTRSATRVSKLSVERETVQTTITPRRSSARRLASSSVIGDVEKSLTRKRLRSPSPNAVVHTVTSSMTAVMTSSSTTISSSTLLSTATTPMLSRISLSNPRSSRIRTRQVRLTTRSEYDDKEEESVKDEEEEMFVDAEEGEDFTCSSSRAISGCRSGPGTPLKWSRLDTNRLVASPAQ